MHGALLRTSPPSYKQIKHISPARLQSRLQSSRQINLIMTAQLPGFKQMKFISTARLQSRLSSSKHQQWRGLSSYIQIKLILAAQLRNSCQVLNKSNWFPQHGCWTASQVVNSKLIPTALWYSSLPSFRQITLVLEAQLRSSLPSTDLSSPSSPTCVWG